MTSAPTEITQHAKAQRITILTPERARTITADVFDIRRVENVVFVYPVNPWTGNKVAARVPAIETAWYVMTGNAIIDGEVCEVVETLPGFWRKA